MPDISNFPQLTTTYTPGDPLTGTDPLTDNTLTTSPYQFGGIQPFINSLLATPAGISEVEGYQEHWGRDESTLVRFFRIPWNGRPLALSWFLGWSNNTGLNPGLITRGVPHQDPEFPSFYAVDMDLILNEGAPYLNPQLQIKDAAGNLRLIPKFAPWTIDPQINQYVISTGRYAVTYAQVPYDVQEDSYVLNVQNNKYPAPELCRYVIRDSNPAAQAIPIPATPNAAGQPPQLKFPNGDVIAATDCGSLPLMTDELLYLWVSVPDIPQAAIDACVGKINSATFDAPWTIDAGGSKVQVGGSPPNGHPPGTLLTLAPTKKRYRNRLGRIVWDLGYRFIRRRGTALDGGPITWNHFPHINNLAGTVGFELATPPYFQSADVNQLFQMPAPVLYQNNKG